MPQARPDAPNSNQGCTKKKQVSGGATEGKEGAAAGSGRGGPGGLSEEGWVYRKHDVLLKKLKMQSAVNAHIWSLQRRC